jgi:glycine/D-amino acid oxidase-like deaminating enzyme/nitrite reductase/ring-hydroxylating ferredoxin subunit
MAGKIDLRSTSVWMDVEAAPEAAPLGMDCTADVAVVGCGIAGLSVAYELLSRGLSVFAIDRGPIAGGMTARTTAHLAPVCDDSLSQLISHRGADLARAFQRSQEAAVDRIEEIQRIEGIDCAFRRLDGILALAPGDSRSTLDDEAAAAATLGVPCERGKGLPVKGMEEVDYLKYPGQATFHPLLYLRGLVKAIEAKDGHVHAHTCMAEVAETDGGVTVKTTEGHTITAGSAIIATNSPVHEAAAIHGKQAPFRTYAMSFELGAAELPDVLLWDTEDPYHYVRRLTGEGGDDLVIVGGEDHKTGDADDANLRFERLTAWISERLPGLGPERHRWSGQVMDTLDFCGYIGRSPGHTRIYLATGDSGQGMTHGVAAGLLLPDLIQGRDSPYTAVYDPSRHPPVGLGTYISQGVTAVKQLVDYIAPSLVGSAEELEDGEGAIIHEGFTIVAAYRDEGGKLYRHSATCTHAGCHLHWNSFERCWDCPCHGSHFSADGEAVNGPAIARLDKLEPE